MGCLCRVVDDGEDREAQSTTEATNIWLWALAQTSRVCPRGFAPVPKRRDWINKVVVQKWFRFVSEVVRLADMWSSRSLL